MFAFLQSYFLYALAAVSLPFLIHLLNRRKPKTIRFSTLFFLRQLQQKKMRRLKIRQLILLLLRALLIAALVTAFARPTVKTNPFFLKKSNVRTAAAILLDNSLSMRLETEEGSAFGRARNQVKELVTRFSEGDRLTLFLSNPTPTYSEPQTFERAETLLQLLGKEKPTFAHGDLTAIMKKALSLLEKSIFPNKELYVFSDFQSTSWQKIQTLQIPQNIRIFWIHVKGRNRGNFAVGNIRLKNQLIEPGKPLHIAATVANYSGSDVNDLFVSMFLNNQRIAQNTVSVKSGQRKDVEFTIVLKEAGFVDGFVELEDDFLSEDNRSYFSFYVPPKIDILVLGDPADSRYFKLALTPDPKLSRLFRFSDERSFPASVRELKRFSVVALIDVDRISQTRAELLLKYVRDGGNLIVFPGDRTDVRFLNDHILKPLQISGFRQVVGQTGNTSAYTTWTTLNWKHPILQNIFQERKNELESPKLFRYLTVDPNQKGWDDVIRLSKQTPLLTIHSAGKGQVALFTTALDPNWSNLVHKPIFPPLLYRTIVYMGFHQTESTSSLVVGQELIWEVSDPTATYKLQRPDGVVEMLRAVPIGGRLGIKYRMTDWPGHYVLRQSDEILQEWAINTPPLESNLEQISLDQVKEKVGGFVFEATTNTDIVRQIQTSRMGSELTRWFFMAALILMLLEMVISRENWLSNFRFMKRFTKEGDKL